MTMPRNLSACLMLALVALTAVDADAQGFKWWQHEKFKTELSLAPDQVARLEAIYQATEPALRTQKVALDQCEQNLSSVVSDRTSDEGRLLKAVERTEAARTELSKTRTLMLFRMRRILTDEQNVKLKALHERDHDRRPKR